MTHGLLGNEALWWLSSVAQSAWQACPWPIFSTIRVGKSRSKETDAGEGFRVTRVCNSRFTGIYVLRLWARKLAHGFGALAFSRLEELWSSYAACARATIGADPAR